MSLNLELIVVATVAVAILVFALSRRDTRTPRNLAFIVVTAGVVAFLAWTLSAAEQCDIASDRNACSRVASPVGQ